MREISAIFQSLWVRKLIGKPAFPTIAECESEARRIHSDYDKGIFPVAVESKALRIHLDLSKPDSRITTDGLRISRVFRTAVELSAIEKEGIFLWRS